MHGQHLVELFYEEEHSGRKPDSIHFVSSTTETDASHNAVAHYELYRVSDKKGSEYYVSVMTKDGLQAHICPPDLLKTHFPEANDQD